MALISPKVSPGSRLVAVWVAVLALGVALWLEVAC